jgi:hypothetical protein
MSYQAGDTYPAAVTIRDGNGAVTDPDALTLTVRMPDATTAAYAYGTDAEVVRDSEGVYHADVPLTTGGMWIFEWATTDEAEVERVQVSVGPAIGAAVTFATLAELTMVLGGSALSAEQSAQGQFLLELGTGLIVEAVDRDDEWAAGLDPIPRVLRAVCLAFAARPLRNPSAASSLSESLGAYSHTTRFESGATSSPAGGLDLSDAEKHLCRRAVVGVTSGSACLPSLATVIADQRNIDGWAVETNPDIYEDIT